MNIIKCIGLKLVFYLSIFLLYFHIILGLNTSSYAATYYIAKTGNDNNPGTEASPWLTIQKAANTMVAGDTVYVKQGTYTERITPKNSGSPGKYITYQNYPGHKVIIQSPNTWTYDCGLCLRDDKSLHYIRFIGLEIRNANLANVDVRASDSFPKSNIIIDGLTIKDGYIGVYFWKGVTNSEIKNCTITGNQKQIYLDRLNNNILIDKNYVSDSKIVRAELDPSNSHNIVLTNSNVADEENYSVTISNNEISYALIQGILVWKGRDILIKGNHVHHNGATGVQIEGDENGVGYDIVVENNICEYNGESSNWETGIWIDDTNRALVQNNIVRFNANGIYVTGSENIIVRKNLINDNYQYYGINLYESPQRGINDDIILTNNTLYKNKVCSTCGGVVIGIGWYEDIAPPTNVVFKNNIVADNLNPHELYVIGDTHQLDYNDYYNSARALKISWQKVDKTWAEYLAASGQDSRSVNSNPLFLDPANADFRLQSNSPCIDTGGFLTQTTSSGSGKTLVVEDARFFTDGFGIPGVSGDRIQLEGQTTTAVVTNVNYTTNTLTLDTSLTWTKGQGVAYAYHGSRPDIGAYEYAIQTLPPPEDTTQPAPPMIIEIK